MKKRLLAAGIVVIFIGIAFLPATIALTPSTSSISKERTLSDSQSEDYEKISFHHAHFQGIGEMWGFFFAVTIHIKKEDKVSTIELFDKEGNLIKTIVFPDEEEGYREISLNGLIPKYHSRPKIHSWNFPFDRRPTWHLNMTLYFGWGIISYND